MYFSRSPVKVGLFCSTFLSVPVFHLMRANTHNLKMWWKIKDQCTELIRHVCADCIC